MTALPDVPTAAEAGLTGYETYGWLALLGPAGTPKPIVDKLYKALDEAVKDPDGARALRSSKAPSRLRAVRRS